MQSSEHLNLIVKDYRRKVRDTSDDIGKGERQLLDFERKLDSLLEYKNECASGYESLPDSAFYYAQRRETRLLLDHVDDAVTEQKQRVSNCKRYIEIKTQQHEEYSEKLQTKETELMMAQHQEAQQKEILKKQREELKEQRGNALVGDTTDSDKAAASGASDKSYSWVKTRKNI